jgi:rhamnose utilization protein RhaD (predicted bifunctional aldolase and dehydrogenase)
LKKLVEISKDIGANLDLVQGAGGNTSVKDNGTLWVKASGCCLKDAGIRDIFVPVDYLKIVKELKSSNDEPVAPEVLQIAGETALRPSIETSLHALMPHRYVIHVHSVNTIANAVLIDGDERVSRLLHGCEWAWVPYVRPGVPLTRAIQKVMHSGVDVLVLANHGLVFGAGSSGEVYGMLKELEKKLYRPRREPTQSGEKELLSLVQNTDYEPSKYSLVHELALDPVALSIASTGPLYPDHIVFLGTGPMSIMTAKGLSEYLEGNKRICEHKVIIVEGLGVVKHKALSESAEEMLHCFANVLLRIQPNEKLRYLTEREETEITGWDAEKFRQATQS